MSLPCLVEVVIYMIITTTMENILRQDELQMIIHLPITLRLFYQELEPQRSVKMKDAENQNQNGPSFNLEKG